ncbi:MAG: nucleotide exchange factor GrpE [Chromatiales bacterium]|nr:nucleotide exchange factor GrpE [Chromatiales bacterium]
MSDEEQSAAPQAVDKQAVPEAGSYEELLLTLQDARAQAEANWNEVLRARAELVNQQRRAERDVENAHKYGVEKLLSELLPALDSLELGLASGMASPERMREGMELTLRLLIGAAGKFSIRQINPAPGDRFDPALHQAMSMQPAVPGGEANRVVVVYQKGYQLNDRLVRPAMVVVSGPPAEGGGETQRIDELA